MNNSNIDDDRIVPPSEWPFREVQSDEHTRELETVEVYVTVVEPRQTNVVLKFIQNHLAPLSGLEHCKRIRRTTTDSGFTLTVILCEKNSISSETLQTLAQDHGLADQIQPIVVPIPRHAPRNKGQYEDWKHLWPMTFREDTRLHPKFTHREVEAIQSHMQQLLVHKAVAARIVNAMGEVVAEATDTRRESEHPLHHAVMNCIDVVAEKERQAGRRKRKSSEIANSPSEREEKIVYLCTGYDLYVTHEPCAMCAMALVHSRIGRVFYSRSTRTGCLGTLHKIHSHSSLNHHYRVFRGVLADADLAYEEELDA